MDNLHRPSSACSPGSIYPSTFLTAFTYEARSQLRSHKMAAGEDEVEVRSGVPNSLQPDQPEAGPSRLKAPRQEGDHTPSRRRNTLQLDGHELDAFRMRNRPSWGGRIPYDEYDEGNEDAAHERRIAEEVGCLAEQLHRSF